ncbi:hypothetical protein E7T06_07175 [Deinococcus sp. Arct2-2]|uniref:hypothetical protein n=1 Tax=Deinococcus sp. Arct2-2 TaxID=2568653 RepID=UPI0010A48DA9|nr:hypothetical protein [Deinococcus sp. Arct2-2]THF70480.1 hypothetical protein E7T06_07175 [Deinococcus sp. Arct2-2]
MHSKVLILGTMHHLQGQRPDSSVLVGDLQDALYKRGITWGRGTIQAYLRELANEGVLERLELNVYRLKPTDKP